MPNHDCIRFLQWALPQMQMRWPGFRRVYKQVCKRLARRIKVLDLKDLDSYRQHLGRNPDEWQQLDGLCRVVVTRFYRDKRVFAELAESVLPSMTASALSSGRKTVNVWSIGSASGEEAYTLAILWHHLLAPRFPEVALSILGTEIDLQQIKRSNRACYPAGSIKNLPDGLRNAAFITGNDECCLKTHYQAMVTFHLQDIRTELPEETFDLILCRNLVFTYYDNTLQNELLQRIKTQLRPGGWLLLGVHESLPTHSEQLTLVSERLGLYTL